MNLKTELFSLKTYPQILHKVLDMFPNDELNATLLKVKNIKTL